MGDAATETEFGQSDLPLFENGAVHAPPQILAEPLVFPSVNTPQGEPSGIVVVNPKDDSPAPLTARDAGS